MRNLQGRWFGPNTIVSLHHEVLSVTTLLEVNLTRFWAVTEYLQWTCQLIQEKYYCSNTPSCRKRMENKCCSYASRYLNPDYARICFADPDGPTSHASSISGRCRRQSSSTALSASGARSRKQCPRPTQACPSTPSHTKGRSSSPTGRDRSC